jgi:isocitrate lyase
MGLSRAMASLIHSLGKLGLDFKLLPLEGQESIWRGIQTFSDDFTPQALSMIIYALSKMNVQWQTDVPGMHIYIYVSMG